MPQNYNACSPQATPPQQYVNNTGTGTLAYNITFPYIAATDIVVFTGETNNWTLRNQGTGVNEYAVNPQTGLGTDQVVFVGATPGTNILITRRTDICNAARVFQAGASIRAEDLNTDMNQLRFLYQELYSFMEMFVGNEGDDLIPGEQERLTAGSGIELTGTPPSVIEVDLATTDPGLQFDANDDLQVTGNRVTNIANPVLENGPSNVTFQSGGGITITGSGSDTVTISAVAGGGGLTFMGTVNVSVAMAGDFLTATQGRAWTADTACGGQGEPAIHASWITALANVAAGGSVDVGDIIACNTNAPPANRLDQFSRIPVGGGFGNLQTVTNNGSTTTNSIVLNNGGTNTTIGGDGSAIFNERGESVDFRVESNSNANMLFVDGSADAVGINEAAPSEALDVRGNIQVGDGNNLVLQNAAETFAVSVNADDATANYNITLPPTAPGAGTRYLRAAGAGIGANQELEWASGGGGATGSANGANQDYIFHENGQTVRTSYTVGTTLAAQPGSGVTTNTCNAMSAGPITINNGITVTIANGSNWIIL